MKTKVVALILLAGLAVLSLVASCTAPNASPAASPTSMTGYVIATNQYSDYGPIASNGQLQPNKTEVFFADGGSVILNGCYTLSLQQLYNFYYYDGEWHLDAPEGE